MGGVDSKPAIACMERVVERLATQKHVMTKVVTRRHFNFQRPVVLCVRNLPGGLDMGLEQNRLRGIAWRPQLNIRENQIKRTVCPKKKKKKKKNTVFKKKKKKKKKKK